MQRKARAIGSGSDRSRMAATTEDGDGGEVSEGEARTQWEGGGQLSTRRSEAQ